MKNAMADENQHDFGYRPKGSPTLCYGLRLVELLLSVDQRRILQL